MRLTVRVGDVLGVEADVLALKYADGHYGADSQVAWELGSMGEDEGNMSPPSGSYTFVPARGEIRARRILFVGVGSLSLLDYQGINQLARRTVRILANSQFPSYRVVTTVHGPGFGLDERESLRSQVLGYVAEERSLGRINIDTLEIVEHDAGRAERFRSMLPAILDEASEQRGSASSGWAGGVAGVLRGSDSPPVDESVATRSTPLAFVAMPFLPEMMDTYYYGIQAPVNKNGFLCERIDLTSFTGDIVDRIKARISAASVLIADLTGANANVYLEVGYAWGRGVPVIFCARKDTNLMFDVKGHRAILYESIKDLETRLDEDLSRLRAAGLV